MFIVQAHWAGFVTRLPPSFATLLESRSEEIGREHFVDMQVRSDYVDQWEHKDGIESTVKQD